MAWLLCAGATPPPADKLARQFRDPPASARPHLWWHWIGGNITREGIVSDLTGMHRIGIGGIHIFDVNLPQPRLIDPSLRPER